MLYKHIHKKTKFIMEAGAHFGKSPQSLRVHWFGNFWSIPERYQDDLILFLQQKIKEQQTPKS